MAGDRITKAEADKRINACFKLRYESDTPITQDRWVEYCHENYGDKSEQQYCNYWAKAKEKYDNGWKEKLSKLLGPAADKIREGLESEDPRTYQRAIDQVMKYTGNDVDRVEVEGNITYFKAKFGDDD